MRHVHTIDLSLVPRQNRRKSEADLLELIAEQQREREQGFMEMCGWGIVLFLLLLAIVGVAA